MLKKFTLSGEELQELRVCGRNYLTISLRGECVKENYLIISFEVENEVEADALKKFTLSVISSQSVRLSDSEGSGTQSVQRVCKELL